MVKREGVHRGVEGLQSINGDGVDKKVQRPSMEKEMKGRSQWPMCWIEKRE